MMKNFKYLIFLSIVLLVSCDNIDWEKLNNPCIDCYNIKPEEGLLEIEFTIDENHKGVPLIIYIDEYEKNQIEWIDTTYEVDYEIWVPVNQDYTVRAQYIRDNDTIYVFDRDNVKIIKESTECDTICWKPRDGKIDVRLKY